MDFEYSPHRSAGGTMHLLSPSHSQYGVDAYPSIQQLRRSLSRSPSKPSRFHLHGLRSPKQSPTSPLSPSALSRGFSIDATSMIDVSNPRPKFTLRKSNIPKATPRRTSPPSSTRRALADGSSKSNAAHISLPFRHNTSGQENRRASVHDTGKHMRFELDNEPIRFDQLKANADKPGTLSMAMRDHMLPGKSSPLKRSDGVMNLDSPHVGSPRAKRRSLHGAMLGADFNVLELGFDGAGSGLERRSSQEDAPPTQPLPHPTMATPSQRSPPRRPFSLRRSTLQQRAGAGGTKSRPSDAEAGASRASASGSPASSRARYRMSLDGSLPMRTLDMPCLSSSQSQRNTSEASRPHPLSKTLSPSSSNSSITDDTTLQAALAQALEPIAPKQGFSKSLPIGALRPRLHDDNDHDETFETPETYKTARPLPSAFMSTGLISKRNRTVELPPSFFGSSTRMPDTPSKKPFIPDFDSTPAHPSVAKKTSQPRHEFGSPTTPFSPHASKTSSESFGKGVSIFGSRVAAGRLIRRASFVSVDGDDASSSPSGKAESPLSMDELPPTPTKPANNTGLRPQSRGKGNSLRSSLLGRRSSLAPDLFTNPDQDCGSQSASSIPVPISQPRSDTAPAFRAPSITFSSTNAQGSPSIARPKLARQVTVMERSPSPLAHRSSLPPFQPSASTSSTKLRPNTPITVQIAQHGDVENDVPLTPQESFTPPDASRLSISNSHGSPAFGASVKGFPPATPTGPRDQPFNFSVSSLNASSSLLQNDVDTTLTSRFGSVHVYGIGEFSMVYRVEKPLRNGPAAALNTGGNFGKVWAVKKSKKPYAGSKDRARKMKEVQILRALSGSEHIIETVDTWEMKNYLYIQTEFCENGNLKDFLTQTGSKARLDDFRIWKILLELTQGIKCIHDAGYIHLDLKPANIFIDWEGVLKIGDFGMASVWPAPPHLDGEGDREYIAPEVLSGRFDKPADIFALGMILCEIAGNIVLPDNGLSWQRLRSGDMSDLPSLTFSSESTLPRDASGEPLATSDVTLVGTDIVMDDDDDDDLGFCTPSANATPRARDLVEPPHFMKNPEDLQSLETLVQRLISPDPDARPVIDEVLASHGVQWVAGRRRAGATIYEGNWGPADDVVNPNRDVEMMDFD